MSDAEKRITVAVPTLNSAATLEETLSSLRAQTGCTANIVVADSGSTDGTLGICKRLGVPSIYVPPGNMYKAINAVLREAGTEWLAYLNSDDYVYPDTFSRLISRAEVDGAGIVYGNCDYVDYNGRPLFSFSSARPWQILPLARRGMFGFAQQAAVFRNAVYKQLGGFDEKYSLSADADFYYRAARAGIVFARLPGAPVASFRLHEKQLTNTMSAAMEKEKVSIREACGPARLPGDLLAVWAWRAGNVPNYLVRSVRKLLR